MDKICKILDAGEKKSIPLYMTKSIKKLQYMEYLKRVNRVKRVSTGQYGKTIETENPDYKEPDRATYPMIYKFTTLEALPYNYRYEINNIFTYDEYEYYKRWKTEWEFEGKKECLFCMLCPKEEIYRYCDMIPFEFAVMINLSPNWKGNVNTTKIKILESFIDRFSSLPRFKNHAFAIECGEFGDFPHLHAVLEFDLKYMHKKAIYQYMKSNIHAEIRKKWRKVSGEIHKPYIKLLDASVAIHCSIITNNDVFRDKLAYLIEDNKPEEHKNMKHKLFPIYKSTWD